MRLTNVSGCEAAWTTGYESDGREMLVIVMKATYTLPANGEEPEPIPEAVPLVQADTFTGDPGLSAPRFETDYAHRKPYCDVLLVGSAYAPPGKAAARVKVGIHVAGLEKQLMVVGNRVWAKGLTGVSVSAPEPFQKMPITYDVAFGGTDRTREAKGQVHTYAANPVGRGYWHDVDNIHGAPLPNTEVVDEPVVTYSGNYRPMAMSPVGRNWSPRFGFAGTYDQSWRDNEAPLWPKDFDYRYFQAASEDQWIPYPRGGEPVILQNLTPDGHRSFRLPTRRMPVTFIPYRGYDVTRDAVLDTIVFEPDDDRFTLTWRTGLPVARSVFDVQEAIAGEMSAGWHRARRSEKEYYPSLGALVAARREEGSPE